MEKIILQWRDMRFSISPKQIYSFKNISLKFGTKVQTKKEKGQEVSKKEYTKTQGVSVETVLFSGAGVNIESEIQRWKARSEDGVAGNLYLGGKDFIGYALMLMSCDISDIQLLGNGKIKYCKISLKFEREESLDTSGDNTGGGGGGGSRKKPKPKKKAAKVVNGVYKYTTAPPIEKATNEWRKVTKPLRPLVHSKTKAVRMTK